MSKLEEMLTRVEAATFCNKSLLWDICKTLNVSLDTEYQDGPTTLEVLIDARAWQCAAVGLVEKMLPGRDVNLEIGKVGPDRVTDAYISGADGYFEEPKTPDAHGYGLTPALALCAALLRALIEQETHALTEREG